MAGDERLRVETVMQCNCAGGVEHNGKKKEIIRVESTFKIQQTKNQLTHSGAGNDLASLGPEPHSRFYPGA